MTGRVHSIQSLGTLDGPGIRFVVFLQGCHLRCGCCHNPDAWDMLGGIECTPEALLKKALRYREYFGKNGGVTVSGGEPLLQPDFVRTFFTLCRKEGLHTCLDTSGSILTDNTRHVLDVTDRVLLDIKYTSDQDYRKYVGCGIQPPLAFLDLLQERNIPTTVRQVIIPTLNDTEENMQALKAIVNAHGCVDKVELLPFHKMCQTKYDTMEILFPFGHLPEPSKSKMQALEAMLNK